MPVSREGQLTRGHWSMWTFWDMAAALLHVLAPSVHGHGRAALVQSR